MKDFGSQLKNNFNRNKDDCCNLRRKNGIKN